MKPKTVKELYDMDLIPDSQKVELWGWEICWDEIERVEFEDSVTVFTGTWKSAVNHYGEMFVRGITTEGHCPTAYTGLQIEVF